MAGTEVETWEVRDTWMSGSVAAQALAARVQAEFSQVAGSEFTAHFGETTYFATGGRMMAWVALDFDQAR